MSFKNIFLFSLMISFASQLRAATQLEIGRQAIQKMPGCYLVDYNYVETAAIKPGYTRDPRLYDVDVNKTVKEWVTLSELSPTHLRIQHVLFLTDLKGQVMAGSELRHQAEDWEYNAPFLYDFVAPNSWTVVKPAADTWTRRITNLDDGLRYQCASTWSSDKAAPEWSCENYAPIPGRETRDMGRKDYNSLERTSRVVIYPDNWLERQNNVKTIYQNDGTKTPLAKEVGKNWYIRLPESECTSAIGFTDSHHEFWSVMREAWAEVLTGDRDFKEIVKTGPDSRYAKVLQVEGKYTGQKLTDASVRRAVKEDIKAVIQEFRLAK